MDLVALNARYEEAKDYKMRWLALYQELYLYVIPNRDAFNEIFSYTDNGKPVTESIWDDTAVLASYQHANDMQGLLIPQDRRWGNFSLDPHLFSEKEIEENKEEMDKINSRIFFYINESNLSRAVSSSNLDLVGGTAALWVESISDQEPLYFRSIPAVALSIEYSTDDVVCTCWYKSKMTGRQVCSTFPQYKGDAYNALTEKPNDLFTVIYGQIKITNDKFYIYCVLEIDPFTPLWERDSSYQQILVYRDRVRPGESDGRGVGIDLLPTIKNLNQVVRDDRKSLAFKANPPMFYDADKYFNPYSIRQWAGAFIPRNPSGRNPIAALEMPHSPEVEDRILRMQETIKRGFQVDPLGEIESPVKTATEISVRENRAQRTSATNISRLINELPKQVFEVSAKILSERRLLSEDRASRINFLRKPKFNFQSPLYDVQKQSDLSKFTTKLQIMQQYFGQGSELAVTNFEEANKFIDECLGLPAKVSKTSAELKKFMQDMQKAQQSAMAPQPTTSAMNVSAPQQQGVTI